MKPKNISTKWAQVTLSIVVFGMLCQLNAGVGPGAPSGIPGIPTGSTNATTIPGGAPMPIPGGVVPTLPPGFPGGVGTLPPTGIPTNSAPMMPSGTIPGGLPGIPGGIPGGLTNGIPGGLLGIPGVGAPNVNPDTGLPIAGPLAGLPTQPVSTNAPPVITPEMMQEALRVFIRESKTIQREARAGNPRQQHNLAVLYTLGIGVPLDFKRAHHWFNKAALQGLPESQFNLAIAYQGGMGVRKDMVVAYKFYSLAATQGLPIAGKGRDHIAQYMSRIQIETAQRMARGFQQGLERWQEMRGFEKAGQSNVNRILGLLPDQNDSGGGNDGD